MEGIWPLLVARYRDEREMRCCSSSFASSMVIHWFMMLMFLLDFDFGLYKLYLHTNLNTCTRPQLRVSVNTPYFGTLVDALD